MTGHGTVMAYVLPTLVAMGFGYLITETSLRRPLFGLKWAWLGFALTVAGTVMAAVPVALGVASVLYTFYPPLVGNPFYYIGVVLVVIGSWIWVALMSINMCGWKRDNPGVPVPLPMFANVAGAYLWAWTSVGAALELLFQVIPVAVGLTNTIDAGLARCSLWTLHAIVYFWLIPSYIAFYTIVPRAIGGRLFSDAMGRLAFILFLVVSMPIGIHHLFMDPQVGSGFKFMHSVFTAMVALPTFLTVFTITASVEIAGRLRGGKGAFGWIAALPWRNPLMLAVAFSFILLGFGGAGGLINMSYQLDTTIHNTQWITGHFHLIFAGAIVIMYLAIAYDIWPHLTGRALMLRADARPALDLVHRHDRADLPLALGRHSRNAAPHGVLRLQRSSDRALGRAGHRVRDRWLDPGDLRRAVLRGADHRPSRAARRCWSLPVQRSGAYAAHRPGGAQRVRAVARPVVRVDADQLRLPDSASAGGRERGSRGHRGRALMSDDRLVSWRNRWFTTAVGVTGGLALVSAIIGLIALPKLQAGTSLGGLWHTICSAAGVFRATSSAENVVMPSQATTRVEVTPRMLENASAKFDRQGRQPRAPLHDVPRRAGHERGQHAEPRRAYPRRYLQGIGGFQVGGTTERDHGAAGRVVIRPGFAGPFGLLRLFATATRLSSRWGGSRAAHRRKWRADAEYSSVRRVSWRARQQSGRLVAGGAAGRLSTSAVAGLRVGGTAQRYQRSDAEHRAPDDAGGDTGGGPVFRQSGALKDCPPVRWCARWKRS